MTTRFVNGQTIDQTDFVQASTGASDGGKAVVLDDAEGKIDRTMIKGAFGGTGADGALNISSGTTNFDLGGVRVFIKNYTSISITGTAAITFTNPHAEGTAIIFRSQGAIVGTSSATRAIDLRDLGGQANGRIGWCGNSGGYTSTATSVQASGSENNGAGGGNLTKGGDGNVTSGSGSPSRAQSYTVGGLPNEPLSKVSKIAIPGGGGAQGATGTAGRGAGGIYFECGGALNITFTIDATGGAATGVSGPGAGGSILFIANSITTNTATLTVTAGTGGAANASAGQSLVTTNEFFA